MFNSKLKEQVKSLTDEVKQLKKLTTTLKDKAVAAMEPPKFKEGDLVQFIEIYRYACFSGISPIRSTVGYIPYSAYNLYDEYSNNTSGYNQKVTGIVLHNNSQVDDNLVRYCQVYRKDTKEAIQISESVLTLEQEIKKCQKSKSVKIKEKN